MVIRYPLSTSIVPVRPMSADAAEQGLLSTARYRMNSADHDLRRAFHAVALLVIACVGACAGTSRKTATTNSIPAATPRELPPPTTVVVPAETTHYPSDSSPPPDTVRLVLPRVLVGFCQGEGCGFGYPLVACTTLTLRAAEDSTAPEVGRVNPGDTVFVETGNFRISAPGIAIVRRAAAVDYQSPSDGELAADSLHLAAGDTLHLLEYHGEGYRAIAYKGRVVIVDEFWSGPVQHSFQDDNHSLPAVSITAPDAIQWLRLRPRNGHAGWWHQERSHALNPEWDGQCPAKP